MVSNELIESLKVFNKTFEQISFMHGHPIEIVNTLISKSNSQQFMFKKYPLICLFQDFDEINGIGGQAEANLNIAICNITTVDKRAEQRYKDNFYPILYPIYNSFLEKVESHRKVIGYDVNHKKIDRLYWGKQVLGGNGANKLADSIDAIELVNFKLIINHNFC